MPFLGICLGLQCAVIEFARHVCNLPQANSTEFEPHPSHPVIDLLPDLEANYAAWERRHFVPEEGLFWQTGHDDGMEFNINSRQTKDILRGAPSFRPSFNAYMWADAQAISRIAALAGDAETAQRFRAKADGPKDRLQALLWDPKREFFFPMYRDNEERDGHQISTTASWSSRS